MNEARTSSLEGKWHVIPSLVWHWARCDSEQSYERYRDGWMGGWQTVRRPASILPFDAALEQHPRDYYIYKWALRTSRENILKGFIFKSLMPIATITILGSFEWDIWLKSPNWRQIPSNLSKRLTDTFGSKYNYLSI